MKKVRLEKINEKTEEEDNSSYSVYRKNKRGQKPTRNKKKK